MRFKNDEKTRFIDGARVRPFAEFSTNDEQFTDPDKRAKLPGGEALEVLDQGATEDVKKKTSQSIQRRRKKIETGEEQVLEQTGSAVL